MSARELRPYLALAAFAALMLAPSAVGIAILIAASVAIGARALLARRPARNARSAALALGRDARGRHVTLSERELSAHGLILGASGAGKTTTLLALLSSHLERGLPVVAIDLKGSPQFRRELARAAAAAGRRLTLWSPDGPACWNPLAHGNPTELKDKLIATERFSEPHYQRAAERYVQNVLQVLQSAGRTPTLANVVELMEPRRLPSLLREVPHPLAERVQDYLLGLGPDQLSAIRGLGSRLAVITESGAGEFLVGVDGANSVDLRASLQGGDAVLFSLNSSKYGKLAAQLGTLAVQDLVTAVGDRLEAGCARPMPQAMIALDEFSALGSAQVVGLLARAREANVSVMLATQELADLERAAAGVRDQVLGNTALKIAHRQDVPASAQAVAQMAGTERVWEETRSLSSSVFGRYDTGRGTRREAERFIVHPNSIKTLQTGEAVVISKLERAPPRTVRVTPARAGPER